jgi:hypothetical protein
MMLNNNQESIAHEYGLQPFEVLTLDPKRTICEKIMSLVRFSYADNPIQDLSLKIRHTYDLHFLLKDEALLAFFESQNFDALLNKVAQDDVNSYKNDNLWLQHHPNESWFFSDLEQSWNALKNSYTNDFATLVIGKLTPEATILGSLTKIKKRMEHISWTIKLT